MYRQLTNLVRISLFSVLLFSSPSATLWSQEKQFSQQPLEFLIRGTVVDESGQPVAGATIQSLAFRKEDRRQTESLRNGAFVLRIPAEGYVGQTLLVTDATNTRAGYVSQYSYTVDDRAPFQIVIRPWNTTTVNVVDLQNQPVPGATVYLIADHQELNKAETDEAGSASMRFPADAKVDWILAYRSSAGFDYYENYNAWPSQDRLDVPSRLKLNLAGAVSAVIEVLDSDDNPVPNVMVVPWTIATENKRSDVNMSGLGMGYTDEKGHATFDWLPRNLKGRITFLVHDEKYHCAINPVYALNTEETTTRTARVKRVATVRGTIRHTDGSPAAGIRLQGEGRGATNMYFRGYTRTDAEGRYQIDIYPEQETILAVTDDRYAAESATEIELKPGEELNDVDFTLGFGTLIHGRLTVGKDRKPQAGQTATLVQKAGEKSNLVRWNETTETGEYRFRVGPGTYTLRLADANLTQLTVINEDEIVHNGHIDRLPRGLISGLVQDDQGQPLASAELRGESIAAPGHAGFKTRTQADGTFSSERWHDRMLLYAFDPVRKQAGYKVITPDDTQATIKCAPAGSLTGTVVDSDGKPLAKRQVVLQMSLSDVGGATFIERIETDGQGNYSVPAVAVGMRGEIYAPLLLGRGQVIEFKVEQAAMQELPPIIDQ